jgi:hypothetical protein
MVRFWISGLMLLTLSRNIMCVKSEQNGIYPRRPSVLCAFNLPTDRREVIAKTVASIVAGVSSLSVPAPAEANVAMAAVSQKYPFVAYGIKADSSPALNPTLKSVPVRVPTIAIPSV